MPPKSEIVPFVRSKSSTPKPAIDSLKLNVINNIDSFVLWLALTSSDVIPNVGEVPS